MAHQLTEKNRNLLSPEGLLTPEQPAKSIAIQNRQDLTPPNVKIYASPVFAPTDSEKSSVKRRRRVPLGELLVDLGLLTSNQVQSALEQQKKLNHHNKLGAVLLEKGYIDEAALIRALYQQSQAADCEKSKQAKFHALVATGRLSQRDLDLALSEAQAQQRPIENLLSERYKLRKQEVGAALGIFYGCPFKEYDARHPPAWDSIRGLNLNYLKAASWIPLQVSDQSVRCSSMTPPPMKKSRTSSGVSRKTDQIFSGHARGYPQIFQHR